MLSPLGAGGMGEVYRARDTRLDRDVAVKVLPSHLSAAPSLRERFDREARAISRLSHAHVCTLFDVGHENGVDYLVMEYLEGETLAEKLARGPLPLDQILRYGAEITTALDKAHRQGVVHRDLKPGNVMITKAGAKVLDFGLAKYVDASSSTHAVTELPTQHKSLTQEGTLLGTIPYMAPEQLEGTEADARTDIFALGALLYEMTTGRRAFSGKSRASLIASIMEHDPAPLSTLAPATPPALDRIIRTCLAKDPDDRWSRDGRRILFASSRTDQSDIFEISVNGGEWRPVVAGEGQQAPTSITPDGKHLIYQSTVGVSRGVMVYSFAEKRSFPFTWSESFERFNSALSPDGRWVAYCGTDTGRAEIYVEPFPPTGERLQITSSGANRTGWSPDGRELYYVDLNGMLFAVPMVPEPGKPVQLFQTEVRTFGERVYFKALPDGRFLVLKDVSKRIVGPLRMIVNWTEAIED